MNKNKRDCSSPNENIAPIRSTMNDDDASASVPAKKPRLEEEERIAVAGRVASVKLQNFMCHANLQIDFNTKQNNCFYIGGPNGSGKSALFAAINLGLGGRGSDNDRGSTVKSYIKDGTPQSKITITLTNKGLNSHPDWDDLISVERTINQSSSTYVMKSIKVSANGHQTEHVISKKKSDIDRIVNRFNIHLSNPAFWMSQDRSRSFLANFKPSNVYKLYLQSTNLENIRQSYVRFAAIIDECSQIVERKSAEVSIQQRKLKRMQEQRELQMRVESDRALIGVYVWKLIFCKVRDLEDEIKLNKKKQEVHDKLHEEWKTQYADNRAERNQLEKAVQDVCEDADLQTEEMGEAQKLQKAKTDEVMKFKDEIKSLEQQNRRKKVDINGCKDAIREAENKLKSMVAKQGNDEVKKQLERKNEEYQRISKEVEKMEIGGEKVQLEERANLIASDLNKKNKEKHETLKEYHKLQGEFTNRQDMLRRAKAAKQNSVNKFGSSMSQILSEIGKRRGEFKALPKGPIGKFVTLKDPQWAYPVEQCLKNVANNFLCHSQSDSAVLRDIFTHLRLPKNERPTIIVSEFSGKRYSNLVEPSDEYPSMYRVLQISDPDVDNLIIDKTSCEQFILLKDKTEAMNLMGSKHPPKNATRAFTSDGSQAYANGPNSQYRFYANNSRDTRPSGLFQQVNLDEAELTKEVKNIEQAKMQIDTDVKQIEKEIQALRREQQSADKEVEEFERKLSNLRGQEIRTRRSVEELQNSIANSSKEEQVTSLSDSIAELKSKLSQSEQEILEIEEKIKETEKEMQPYVKEREESAKTYAELKKELEELNRSILKFHEDMAVLDKKGDVLQLRLEKLAADEQVLYHREARLLTERDFAVESLETEKLTTPMPPTEQDPPDLTDFPVSDKAKLKLAELQKSVERASKGCDMSITHETVKDFKETLKMHRFFCRQLEEAVESLREVHAARCRGYVSLKTYTEMKVCDKFQELLEVRGHFIGGLEFDHDKETLNVNVQSCKEKDSMADRPPEDDDDGEDEEEEELEDDDSDDGHAPRRKKAKKQPKKKKNRDLKGLSGGERSFVTAALVMSLWEVMEQPFRMLDEFDVFMDMMNRKLVMDLLVELATKKFPHNQFIFFTPQGIKELKIVDGLQVFEMNKVRD
ncbi:hypothetical protein B9Z55_005920 [Caenorhabditis nigoni]|nr:hypothetical protein B9Z55_005920 [Caenorhabditis nigoni]